MNEIITDRVGIAMTSIFRAKHLHPIPLLLVVLFFLGCFFVHFSEGSFADERKQTIHTPQDLYGVGTSADPFNINASAMTSLSYESTNTSVAAVSENGTVSLTGKPGFSIIRITAEKDDGYSSASKNIVVRVTEYKKANGLMVHAKSSDDDLPGDPYDLETILCRYRYADSDQDRRSWNFILRCNDPYVADNAAIVARHVAGNEHFGFNSRKPTSQRSVDLRASIYKAIVEVVGKTPSSSDLRRIKKIDTYAETSCTPTILAGYWLYYDMDTRLNLRWIGEYSEKPYYYYCGAVNVEAHQLETAIRQVNREYRERGQLEPFSIIYIPKEKRASFFSPQNAQKNLKRGDIVCCSPDPSESGHTAMIQ